MTKTHTFNLSLMFTSCELFDVYRYVLNEASYARSTSSIQSDGNVQQLILLNLMPSISQV